MNSFRRKLTGLFIFSFFLLLTGYAQKPLYMNRHWVLEKLKNTETREVLYPDEIHYLEFGEDKISFSVDCNQCGVSYEFIAKDTINFFGPAMCTRRNCNEKKSMNISYSGKAKIWLEYGFLHLRMNGWDHIYK